MEMIRKSTQEAENKTKTKHWWENIETRSINKRPEYLEMLNRKECNAIIKKQNINATCENEPKIQIPKEHHLQILQELPWNPEAHYRRM